MVIDSLEKNNPEVPMVETSGCDVYMRKLCFCYLSDSDASW